MTNSTLHHSVETSKKAAFGRTNREDPINTRPSRCWLSDRFQSAFARSFPREELSRQFSLTRELLRQIEVQALRKVRERTRSVYSREHYSAQSAREGHATSTSH